MAAPLRRLTTGEVVKSLGAMLAALAPGSARLGLALTSVAERDDSVGGMARALLRPAHSHFCVEDNPVIANRVLSRMGDLGMGGIIDYAAEAARTETEAEVNMRHVASTATEAIRNRTAIVCKISALSPPGLLEQESQRIWKEHAGADGSNTVLADSSVQPNHFPAEVPYADVATAAAALSRVQERLFFVCEAARRAGVQVMVDAEEWAIQPAVDTLTVSAMERFNQDVPLVHGTIQAYLGDADARMERMIELAADKGFKPGVKLVRGAYMELERARAEETGIPCPVLPTIEHTAEQYSRCASLAIDEFGYMGGNLLLATHNSETVDHLIDQHRLDKKGNTHVHFAQLKGMSDSLSLRLAADGLSVSKYVPYGPLHHTLKYLARRALENSAASSAVSRDAKLLFLELERRAEESVWRGLKNVAGSWSGDLSIKPKSV